ncbi:hypothetical protein Ancab_038218 [Ancistrocladus abbreviatus]
MPLVDSVAEGFECLIPDENLECHAQETTPKVPSIPEDLECSVHHEENGEDHISKGEVEQSIGCALESKSLFLNSNSDWFLQNEIPPAPPMPNDVKILASDEEKKEQVLESEDKQLVECVQGSESLIIDKSSAWFVKNEGSGAPAMGEDLDFSKCSEENAGKEQDMKYAVMESVDSALFVDVHTECFGKKETPLAPITPHKNGGDKQLIDVDVQLMDTILEGLDVLFSDQNPEWLLQQQKVQSALPLPECVHLVPSNLETEGLDQGVSEAQFVEEVGCGREPREEKETLEATLSAEESFELKIEVKSPRGASLTPNWTGKLDGAIPNGKATSVLTVDTHQRIENQISPRIHQEQNGPWSFWSAAYSAGSLNLSPPTTGVLLETENCQLEKNHCLQCEIASGQLDSERKSLDCADVNVNKGSLRKDTEQTEIWSFWSRNLGTESVYSFLSNSEGLSESENEQVNSENKSSVSIIVREKSSGKISLHSPPTRSGQKSNLPSIWSRRGNPVSSIQIQTNAAKGEKINNNEENIKCKPISRALFGGVDDQEEEIFTPDKENYTPNTRETIRKLACLKEAKHSNLDRSPLFKTISKSNIHLEEDTMAFLDKENQMPKVLQEKKSVRLSSRNLAKLVTSTNRGERMPFQTLFANSPQKSVPETCISNAPARSCNSVSCTEPPNDTKCSIEGTQSRWNMIVDTTCLLNKESRRALQLLEGLKGTQLIIPRIVIRELDCMKRQSNLFRRKTDVTSALQWIEECMVKTKWWIHIQCSMEDGMSTAPTPPASPQSFFSSGITATFPFSAFGTPLEVVSPTTEDHILDYAFLCRRTKNDGQLVLLTSDVTLKIKAMAEGLICETAEEFRESLVNPFSERFLWANSSPRGQTWSCLDDIVLMENFYPSSQKMSPKAECVKGLKLILLHNAQYGRISSIR